jgi:hypothetical protein
MSGVLASHSLYGVHCSVESRRETCYRQPIVFRQNARMTLVMPNTMSLIEPAREDPLLSRIKELTLLSTWKYHNPITPPRTS